MRLDTFATQNKISRVDFLWADVQGAEKDLLLGGVEIFAKTVPLTPSTGKMHCKKVRLPCAAFESCCQTFKLFIASQKME